MFDFASLPIGQVKTLVDVGAGLGTFLGPALEYYKPERWLAIEMLPERAAYLQSYFLDQNCGDWTISGDVENTAVGEVSGAASIRRTKSADSSSLLVIDPRSQDWFTVGPHGMDQRTNAFGQVTIRTLDDFCSYLPTIDLMKMDIQGYEGRAIRGGKETLKRTRALIIEVLFVHHYEGQSEADEIDKGLRDLGFKPDRWLTKDYNGDLLLQGDALYVNTRTDL